MSCDKRFLDSQNLRPQRCVGPDRSLDLLNPVQDCRVITSTKLATNLEQRGVRFGAQQIHGHLTGQHNVFGARPAGQLTAVDAKVAQYRAYDLVTRDSGAPYGPTVKERFHG